MCATIELNAQLIVISILYITYTIYYSKHISIHMHLFRFLHWTLVCIRQHVCMCVCVLGKDRHQLPCMMWFDVACSLWMVPSTLHCDSKGDLKWRQNELAAGVTCAHTCVPFASWKLDWLQNSHRASCRFAATLCRHIPRTLIAITHRRPKTTELQF